MKNNYSTYASLLAETPDEAKMVDRWLEERNVDIELRVEAQKTIPSLPVEDRPTLAKACDQYNADIQPGQIRILSKRFTEDPDVIPYVAVLEMWDDGMWLVAPFSQYTTPATSGEMATGINIQGLNVIQAWNGRTVQSRLLEKSFLFGELDEVVREQALALFRHEFGGVDLPIGFNALRGPAIVMAGDPRRDYVAETIARLRPLSTAVKATQRVLGEIYGEDVEQEDTARDVEESDSTEGDVSGDPMILRVDFEAAVAKQREHTLMRPFYGMSAYRESLAAGNKDQQKTERFVVCDTELSLTYSPEERSAMLTFYDKNDQPDPAFDGYAILGTGFEFLGTFKDGTACVPAELVQNWFQITDRDGNAVPLMKRK